jgi:hypothetical protein
VVFFGQEHQMHGEAPRASFEKVVKMREKGGGGTTHGGGYTVHKGQFKFHYRKSMWDNATRETNGDDPVFTGEHFIDAEFMQLVNATHVRLE